MASRKSQKRHEMALRMDDLAVLREAARTGRAAMMSALRAKKIEMQRGIEAVEILDDVLTRLDVQMLKASDALGVQLPLGNEPTATETAE